MHVAVSSILSRTYAHAGLLCRCRHLATGVVAEGLEILLPSHACLHIPSVNKEKVGQGSSQCSGYHSTLSCMLPLPILTPSWRLHRPPNMIVKKGVDKANRVNVCGYLRQ